MLLPFHFRIDCPVYLLLGFAPIEQCCNLAYCNHHDFAAQIFCLVHHFTATEHDVTEPLSWLVIPSIHQRAFFRGIDKGAKLIHWIHCLSDDR